MNLEFCTIFDTVSVFLLFKFFIFWNFVNFKNYGLKRHVSWTVAEVSSETEIGIERIFHNKTAGYLWHILRLPNLVKMHF